MGVATLANEVIGALDERGTYRRMRVFAGAQGPRMRVDGREVLIFAGSNYRLCCSRPGNHSTRRRSNAA